MRGALVASARAILVSEAVPSKCLVLRTTSPPRKRESCSDARRWGKTVSQASSRRRLARPACVVRIAFPDLQTRIMSITARANAAPRGRRQLVRAGRRLRVERVIEPLMAAILKTSKRHRQQFQQMAARHGGASMSSSSEFGTKEPWGGSLADCILGNMRRGVQVRDATHSVHHV